MDLMGTRETEGDDEAVARMWKEHETTALDIGDMAHGSSFNPQDRNRT
jgi:hypothetical protein